MRILKILALCLLFALPLFAQTEISKLSDLKGKNKVYIDTVDDFSKRWIKGVLKKDKTFEVVSDAAEADFIIDHANLTNSAMNRPNPLSVGFETEFVNFTSEMKIYYYNADNVKVVTWIKNKTSRGSVNPKFSNEVELTKEFLTELKKL